MNRKNTAVQSKSSFTRWPLALVAAGLLQFSSVANAWDVSGIWDVTVLTRTDVVPIKAPGLIPEHTVSIADDTYTFSRDGRFETYGIDGWWTQKRSQYNISVTPYELESQFRDSLQQAEPGIVIYQLKLLSRKLSGSAFENKLDDELDDGLWGVEKYEYKIDSAYDGFRDVIKLVITSNVAGKPKASAAKKLPSGVAAATVGSDAKRSPVVDAAVKAVVQHMRQRSAQTQ